MQPTTRDLMNLVVLRSSEQAFIVATSIIGYPTYVGYILNIAATPFYFILFFFLLVPNLENVVKNSV